MKIFSSSKLNLTGIIFFLILFPFLSFSQRTTKIDIVNANSLEFDKRIGEDVKRLIGNVVLQNEQTLLYCDSAYFYSESNSVDAFGHVRVNSDSVIIYSDILHYEGNTKTARADRNVRMIDNKTVLTTDHLTYNTKTNIGNYETGGKITDPENVLTSLIGYYYANEKNFYFKKNVVLVNPRYTMKSDTLIYNSATEISNFRGPTNIVSKENHIYCEKGWYDTKNDIAQFNKNNYFTNKVQKLWGDSIYYNRKTGFGKAYNNVTAIDTAQQITMKGDYAEYYEKPGKTMMTKKAMLIQNIDGDSLFLHADTLKAFFDSTGVGKRLYAYNHAKFYKTDMQGLCDSMVYLFKDSIIFMYKAPMLWSDKNQLSADTIKIFLKNKQVHQMNLYNSSFVISKDDSIRYNQIKGKNLIGHFVNNKLSKINVYGNGETIYYVRDEKNGIVGVNKAVAENLLILVNENQIKSITFLAKPEATLYPEKDLSKNDVRLKNFKWDEDKRPFEPDDIFY